jgi:hypothetical protein
MVAGRFDSKKADWLLRAAQQCESIHVIDLCNTTGISDKIVEKLLSLTHVVVVAVAGAANCSSIRDAHPTSKKLVYMTNPAFLDSDRNDVFDLHRRFYAFRYAVKRALTPILTGWSVDAPSV